MKKQKQYTWHAGAPNNKNFYAAQKELIKKLKLNYKDNGLAPPKFVNINNKWESKKSKSLEIH